MRQVAGGVVALAVGFGGGWVVSRQIGLPRTALAGGATAAVAATLETPVATAEPPPVYPSAQAAWLARLLAATRDDLPGLYAEALAADGGQPGEAMRALFLRWAELDAPGGWDFVQTVEGEAWAKLRGMGDFLKEWAKVDVSAAIHAGGALPATRDRSILLSWLASSLAAHAPEAIFAHAEVLQKGEDFDYFLTDAASNWNEDDPAAASAYLSHLSDAMRRQRFVAGIASGWARRDPEAAEHWATSLTDKNERNQALLGLAQTIITSDLASAARLVQEAYRIGSGYDGIQGLGEGITLSSVVKRLAQNDLTGAMNWLLALDPERIHMGTVVSMLLQHLPTDAPMTVSLMASLPDLPGLDNEMAGLHSFQPLINLEGGFAALEQVSDPERKEILRSTLIRSQAVSDPAAAARLALDVPEGPRQHSLLSAIADQWARHDPEAASAWIGALPAGAGREAAVKAFLPEAAYVDGPVALQWARQLADENERLEAIQTVFRHWPAGQRAEAEAMLEALDVPEMIKKNVRQNYRQQHR